MKRNKLLLFQVLLLVSNVLFSQNTLSISNTSGMALKSKGDWKIIMEIN